MRKRIIMLLTNGFDPDIRVYKEAKYLLSRGYEITILCWDREVEKNYPETEDCEGIELVRFKIMSKPGSRWKQLRQFFRYISLCRKYLRKHTCDYLHCHDIDGAITGYLSRKNKMQMIFDMHEFYEQGNAISMWAWRKLTLFLLKKSCAGLYENDVYLSNSYKRVHNKLFPLKNYPDRNLIESLPKVQDGFFKIGYHGAVRRQIPEFTALFEAVKDMADVRVDINGAGVDLVELQQLQKKYNNVFVHGAFDGTSQLTGLYQKTDLLFCGYNPADPNMQGVAEIVKYFEAIITGTPMLATESLAVGKRVKENGFGLVCDTRNVEEIKKCIEFIKENKQEWKKFSQNEMAQAHKYDWNEAVKILDKIYD